MRDQAGGLEAVAPAPGGETASSSAPLPAGGGSELIWGCGLGRGQVNLPSSRAWAGSVSTAGRAWAAAGGGCHADRCTAGPAKPRFGGASPHPTLLS